MTKSKSNRSKHVIMGYITTPSCSCSLIANCDGLSMCLANAVVRLPFMPILDLIGFGSILPIDTNMTSTGVSMKCDR